MSNEIPPPSGRVKVNRYPARGSYDQTMIREILDEGLICHVGFVTDGQPFVIPTTYARIGDRLLIHGSPASRMLRTAKDGVPVCVTVTLHDGLVLARSAFNHSMNYRSVVILGIASELENPAEKMEALEAFVEHVIPGRWADVRRPTEDEIRRTLVLTLPLAEASAKIRKGGPVDDEPDLELGCWAGHIPLTITAGAPIPEARLRSGINTPSYAAEYRRPNGDSARRGATGG